MKYVLSFVSICTLCGVLALGQDTEPSTKTGTASPTANSGDQGPNGPKTGNTYGPIDVLSDTNGLDLRPYLAQLLRQIKAIWYENIPEAARPPIRKKGKVSIEFRVMKDGKIEDMKYVETSGDAPLDRAAYESIIASNPLSPLPSGFPCEYVALRFHFYYNPDKTDHVNYAIQENGLRPCPIGITISPGWAQLAVGETQQFSATLTGDPSLPVRWSVEGPGCTASACGVISSGGLYVAPADIPDPPTINVIATIANKPDKTASAHVVILHSSPVD
jgi:TonB family protein